MKKTIIFMVMVYACSILHAVHAQNSSDTITFPSQDMLTVTADLYMPYADTAPFIILFHQAQYSRGEYLEISPKLNALGFNVMAIDQRSGNQVNGVVNETAKQANAQNLPVTYLDALPDIMAAISHAKTNYAAGKLILWGSSYSAALVLKIGGDNPGIADGLVAFSPGEYFGQFGAGDDFITVSAAKITDPVFITSAASEQTDWQGLFNAISSPGKVSFLPASGGVHGSSALLEKNSEHLEYWAAVGQFLNQFQGSQPLQTVPTNPTLSVSVSGTTVSLSWSADNADTYILYAAPYPDASVIYDFDVGNQTSVSFDLPADSAFYVAVRASNSAGLSDWSNVEHFDLSQKTPTSSTCGAYIAPGVWKQFDCYNLAAVGKTTSDDPFTPSWRLIGGYWQWGRIGPDPSVWHDTNTEYFAHGPTGPGTGEANEGIISSWDQTDAPDGAWSDSNKTANDPCPAGYRVPTHSQWGGVMNNNALSTVGSWSNSATNYSSAGSFGSDLMLPATGYRSLKHGALYSRGDGGYYWSSSEASSSEAWGLYVSSNSLGPVDYYRRNGTSVRCIAE